MQVFKFVLDCLDVFHIDLRLLLYVIRLAGWLKHCNLSLSLSHSKMIVSHMCVWSHSLRTYERVYISMER